MIPVELARALRDAGVRWTPKAGDAFVIDRFEADDEVFILSDMTVEAHEFSTGTVLGFNGTTEWALDSVAIDDALWLPHEHQLRELLGSTFRSLAAGFTVEITIDDQTHRFSADAPAAAYAKALLALRESFEVRP